VGVVSSATGIVGDLKQNAPTADTTAPLERLELLCDEGSLDVIRSSVRSNRIGTLARPGDGVVAGLGRIGGRQVACYAQDARFLGGSLGEAQADTIDRLLQLAGRARLPVVSVIESGGARMQEGTLSLMQMAKTSAALARLSDARLPFISVLTDPTTGGVAASFAMLGDVIISEPGALVGFAGPRVIEQTIQQKLPEGFQRAEFLLEHGMVDMIVERSRLKATLSMILRYLSGSGDR